jgi:hypothetical protein
MSTHPDEWYEIQTVQGESEDIREYLSLSRPEAEPTAWYVQYDGVEEDSELTVYGDVTRQEAIDTATKIIKREGRLPHNIYYKERA